MVRFRYYVQAQELELLATLESLMAEENWQPADDATGECTKPDSTTWHRL